jgi:hypothetical protein
MSEIGRFEKIVMVQDSVLGKPPHPPSPGYVTKAPFDIRSQVTTSALVACPLLTSSAAAIRLRGPVWHACAIVGPVTRSLPIMLISHGAPQKPRHCGIVTPSTAWSNDSGAMHRRLSSVFATSAAKRMLCKPAKTPCHFTNGVDQ